MLKIFYNFYFTVSVFENEIVIKLGHFRHSFYMSKMSKNY